MPLLSGYTCSDQEENGDDGNFNVAGDNVGVGVFKWHKRRPKSHRQKNQNKKSQTAHAKKRAPAAQTTNCTVAHGEFPVNSINLDDAVHAFVLHVCTCTYTYVCI
uniref:Uncharacterized protein n=1 Tax=Ceratitis capitata TaxID=7213 RepID=W8B546_CERCA